MDETYNTKAIILRRQIFREHDLRVRVLSLQAGKLDLVVRGGAKLSSKLAGHLEPLNYVNGMVVRGRYYDYLGTAVSKNCFINIKGDFDRLNLASQVVRTVDKSLRENEPLVNIFRLLNEFLIFLNNNQNLNSDFFYNIFVLRLFSELGYLPELYFCITCGNKIIDKRNFFNFAQGGLICHNCKRQNQNQKNILTVSNDCIKILRLTLQKNFFDLYKLDLDKNLLSEFNHKVQLWARYYL